MAPMDMGGLDQNLPFWEMPFGHPFEGYFFGERPHRSRWGSRNPETDSERPF